MANAIRKKAPIQRGVGVALWRQIADDIRGGIASGTLTGIDGRLPPESELAARFQVNRHTVRAAIAALAHEGVLYSMQGRGTFARKQKRFAYPIGERTRFAAGLENQTTESKKEMLASAIEPAPSEVATALGLEPDAQVVRIETLGSADGSPVSRATFWFSAKRFPTIAEVYARTRSVTQSLLELGVPDYLRASTRIEAHHASQADTADLKLSPGAIVIYTQALNVELDGTPLQYSRTRFAADRVELVVTTAHVTQTGKTLNS